MSTLAHPLPAAPANALREVLARPDIWRGDALAYAPAPGLASGFALLDAQLPGGGWPRGQLCELLHTLRGIGELSLLLPALRHLTQTGRQVVMVLPPAAPWRPHAPAWAAAGLCLEHLLLVQTRHPRDALWATIESLRCSAVAATLFWPDAMSLTGSPGRDAASPAARLRRLHNAAGEGGGCAFALRPLACAAQASAAPLRLTLTPEGNALRIDIIKRRGRAAAAPLHLPVSRPLSAERPAHAVDRPEPARRVHTLAEPV